MKRSRSKPFALSGPPTFGSVVRGARLGYHWSHRHGCFVRISGDGPPWEIRLAPNGGIPNVSSKSEYRVWWEHEDHEEILELIIPLRNVRGVKKPIMFFVDDKGRSPKYEAA